MRSGNGAGDRSGAVEATRVALIGEEEALIEGSAADLRDDCDVVLFGDPEQAVRRIESEPFHVIVAALDFSTERALEVLRRLRRARPMSELIAVGGAVPPAVIVTAMRIGANDFLCQPLGREALARSLTEAAARARSAATPAAESAVEGLQGESPAMQNVRKLIARMADSDLPVLILGQSGTGKELAARALHAASPRVGGPFVAINCAGLPETLIDSELFGHERGAFTGAQASRQGLFDAADGGTLFLDEIGDMPPPTQVRLLRTLQEGEVRPVGATRPHLVDVRVVSATHVDMGRAVAAGQFRHDLFFRLSTIKIELPRLSARGRDILLLAEKLLATSATKARRRVPQLSEEVVDALMRYPWPGNVRELKSAIEYALSLARGETIELEDLPPSIGGDVSRSEDSAISEPGYDELPSAAYVQARRQLLVDFDRRYFERLLRHTKGNLSEASRHSGVDRSNLRRLLKEIGLDATDFRPR